MAETPDEILRALADPERLAIAGALARSEQTATALAESLGISVGRVRRHLNRLTATGIARLREDRKAYLLDAETLRWAAEQAGPPRDAGLALGATTEDEEVVLRTFFRDGRLTEPGVRYDEKTVNVMVGRFHNDHAAIRRYLVDGGLLSRERGEYWRSGGRVEP